MFVIFALVRVEISEVRVVILAVFISAIELVI